MKLAEALYGNVSGWAIIRPDHCSFHDIDFIEADEEPSLETMKEAVDGYIEHITLHYFSSATKRTYQADGLVNEEGKLIGLPFNLLGTAWYANRNDAIVGNLMVMLGKARMK